MAHSFLDAQALKRYDHNALEALFHAVADLRGKRLTRAEVLSIYAEGVMLVFSGHALSHAPELNYALFYSRASTRLPVILTLRCFTARSQSHAEVIRYGDPERLVVAGTLHNGKFSGASTTWMKSIDPKSGRHTLGLHLNQLFLDYYDVEREPSWANPVAQAWSPV